MKTLLVLLCCLVALPLAATPEAEQKLEELNWLMEQRREQNYSASDGHKLGYFLHKSAIETDTALVYLHGIASHAGWFSLAAVRLAERGMDVYSLDRRGSGVNRGSKGIAAGHIYDFQVFIDDLHSFVESIRQDYDKVLLVGLSWGGKLATAFALQHPGSVDGLILVTPGLVAKADYGLPTKLSIAFCHLWCQENHYPLPITPAMFSSDSTWVNFIESDLLRNRTVSAEFLWQTRELDLYIEARIDSLNTPTLLFLAGRDQIVDNAGVASLLLKGKQPMTVKVYPKQIHAVQLEIPSRLTADIQIWRELEYQP